MSVLSLRDRVCNLSSLKVKFEDQIHPESRNFSLQFGNDSQWARLETTGEKRENAKTANSCLTFSAQTYCHHSQQTGHAFMQEKNSVEKSLLSLFSGCISGWNKEIGGKQ